MVRLRRKNGFEHGYFGVLADGRFARIGTVRFSSTRFVLRWPRSQSNVTRAIGRVRKQSRIKWVCECYLYFNFREQIYFFRNLDHVVVHPATSKPEARLFLFSDPSHVIKRFRNCFFNRKMAFRAGSDNRKKKDYLLEYETIR